MTYLPFRLIVVFFGFLFTFFVTATLERDTKFYQIYYDNNWKPVPLLASSNFSTSVRTPLRRYGILPCDCDNLQCGCCVNTNFLSVKRSACMNMTYDPDEFAVGMDMLWNGDSVYQNSISAKNPPPACMEAPIPYLPSVQFCIKMFDIHTFGRNIHACINFETRLARAPILVLEFDCLHMGADGLDLVKFNTTTTTTENTSMENLEASSIAENKNKTEA